MMQKIIQSTTNYKLQNTDWGGGGDKKYITLHVLFQLLFFAGLTNSFATSCSRRINYI